MTFLQYSSDESGASSSGPSHPGPENRPHSRGPRLSESHGGTPTPPAELPESLADALRTTATRHGEQGIVFIEAEGEAFLSYPDLLAEAERILKGLRQRGLPPGAPVLFQFARNRDFFPAFWGCVLGGFLPVPLAPPPSYEEENGARERFKSAWELLGRPPVFTDAQTRLVLEGAARSLGMDSLRVWDVEGVRQPARDSRGHPAQRQDLALLMLTSGSTGTGKAVSLTHHNLLARTAGSVRRNGFCSADVSLNWMPLDHVGGIIYFHLRDVILGAKQIHAATGLVLEQPQRWLDWMARHRVSVTWAPNFAYSLIVENRERIRQGAWDLSSVRHIMNGGEAVVARTGRRFLELLGAHGLRPDVLRPAYGMAEISSGVTYSHEFDLGRLADSDPFVAVGRPIPGVSLRIVDGDDRVLPEREIGQLQVSGETVMRGYYNDPEKTRAVFTPDGWFRTGDLGFLRDGFLTLTGREKDVIIIHGQNVYAHGIESAVEDLPGVQASFTAASAVRSESSNTDEIALFFCPVAGLDEGATWDLIKQIRRTVLQKIGGAAIQVIPLAPADIPKTSLGKIQKAQLRQQFEAGSFEPVRQRWAALGQARLQTEAAAALPQSDVESQITGIWKDVLKVPQLGIHHNFFELGGHSLLLVQAHARLKSVFPAVTVVDFFKYPTAYQLAQHLTGNGRGPSGAELARQRLSQRRQAQAREGSPAKLAQDVAVVGMSCRFPGAPNLAAFWENLKQGVESIVFFSPEELIAAGVDPRTVQDPRYVRAGAILEEVEGFDAEFFGFTPREAEAMDPQHRVFLETCWEALEDAGIDPLTHKGKIGLYAGASMNTYLLNHLLPHRYRSGAAASQVDINDMAGFQLMVANDKDFLPTRIAYKLNLTGPSINVQTACSTSLVAIAMAYQSVCHGECDLALAGGVAIKVPQVAGYLPQEGTIISPDGHCRAFDARAEGTLFGSGSGVVLLRPLEAALRDRNPIYAVIKAAAINNDGGLKVGYAAPSENGQAAVVAEALELGGIAADSLTYLEAHGTGTLLGDPIEVAAMTQGLRTGTDKTGFCALGSVKPNIGHLQIASGVAGFIKTALMLRHQAIPATLHFAEPNPKIDFANSPFVVNTRYRPWETPPGTPRRAGVNSVGIGGTNAFAILEEAPPPTAPRVPDPRSLFLLPLSAKTEPALRALAARMLRFIEEHPEVPLGDLCFTAGAGRHPLPRRLAIVARDLAQLRETLAAFVAGGESQTLLGDARQTATHKTGFLFAGAAGGLSPADDRFLQSQPTFRAVLAGAPRGFDTSADCLSLSLHYAVAQVWLAWGVRPDLLAGHGLGAFAAACVAGVFRWEDALTLVALREQWRAARPADASAVAAEFRQAAEAITYGSPQIPLVSPTGAVLTAADVMRAEHWILQMDTPGAADATVPPFPGAPDFWVAAGQHPTPAGESLLHRLGAYFVQGGRVDWEAFHRDYDVARIPLPTYPWQRQRHWIDAPAVPSTSHEPTPLPTPLDLQRALSPWIEAAAHAEDGYRELFVRLETLSTAYVLMALEPLGWKPQPGERVDSGALATQLGVQPRQVPLWRRMLAMLGEDGVLRAQGPDWQVVAVPEPPPPAAELARLLERYPQAAALLQLFQRCAEALAPVLRGTTDPLQLLFPAGDLEQATRFYQELPGAKAMHALARQALSVVLERLPATRPLRILEIGAGTGSTTLELLPKLSPQRTEYWFTDVSPLFTSRAAGTLRAYPFVRTQVLDIERSPHDQGFGAGAFDVVIAANVLHATAQLEKTLGHVRSLLAPGGLLLLLEATKPQRWLDLTFGQTEGWWRFLQDPRRSGSPLAAPELWQRLLAQQGFAGFAACATPSQAFLIAQVPAQGGAFVEAPACAPVAEGRPVPAASSPSRAVELRLQFQAAASPEARRALATSCLTQTVSAAFKLSAAGLEPDVSLNQVGIDSLVAIDLKNRLRAEFGVEIPASAFLGDATIATLAATLTQLLERESPDAALTSADASTSLASAGPEIPLSAGQQALWFVHRTAPESPAYNIATPLRFASPIAPAALRQALQHLWDRHDLLRATFPAGSGAMVQTLRPRGESVAWVEIEASAWDEARLREAVIAANERPFDFENGPLFRSFWFHREQGESVLLLSVHHIVFDGASLWLLLDELRRSYAALAAGRQPDLPPLTHRYSDFVRAQALWHAGVGGEHAWRYWRDALGGELPLLQLPTDRPRSPGQSPAGGTCRFRLDAPLTQGLKALARAEDTTLFTLLLSAYFILLHRYSGQEDLLVGTPAGGRTDPRFTGVVGYFINPILLRARPRAAQSVTSFLRQVREVVLAGIDHQDYPLPRLIERLQPQRGTGYAPLFQTAFLLHGARPDQAEQLFAGDESARLTWGELTLRPFVIPQQEGQFELALEMMESVDALVGSLKYNRNLFDAATAEGMTQHLQMLLAGMLEDPQQPLASLPLLTTCEEMDLLAWNRTRRPFPKNETVVDQFEAQARRRPDATALVFGEQRLSYAALAARANQLAHFLRARGVAPETLVGVCLDRSLEMFVVVLGILKAGGAYLPLDPDQPRERLTFILEDAAPALVVSSGEFRDKLAVAPERLVLMERDAAAFAACPDADLPRQGGPDSLAYVIYTSGTTGVPKGVMTPHSGLHNLCCFQEEALQVTPESRVLQFAPLFFDASVWEWVMALPRGAELHLAPRDQLLPSAALAQLLAAREITHVTLPPSALAVLPEALLPRLRVLVSAGEACSAALVTRWSKGRTFINAYGPTETTVCATLAECRADGQPPTIGFPIANAEVHLLDHHLKPVPVGVPGELCVAGAGLARGYRNRPELNAASFVETSILGQHRRLYRTGDLARRRADGAIEYLGRLDHQVKLRGIRIEPAEIEVVLRQHEAVRDAVVVLAGDDANPSLWAAVTLSGAPSAELSGSSLRAWLQERLPAAMVPARITILEALPLTPNGKIDRQALRTRRSPQPSAAGGVPPQTRLERQIAAIWQDLLHVSEVGLHDNFFDLGGHSLLLGKVQSRLEALLQKPLPIARLFQYPTIESLAAFLAEPASRDAAASARAAAPAQVGTRDIAIIGLAGRFPGASGIEAFWRNLREGVESIRFFSDEELLAAGVSRETLRHPHYVKAGGYLDDAPLFDASFFGYSPREAEILGPEQRLFLECAWEALEHAGYDVERLEATVGVYAGSGAPRYLLENLLSNPALVEDVGLYQLTTANDKDFLCTRTSYKLNLKGPSVAVQTACSSSLVAVHMACESLLRGECDVALAGGVSLPSPNKRGYLHEPSMITSADGHCRAFDARATGTVAGNGVGIVVLKPLERALADRDTIWAVIKGSAVNNDGAAKVGYTSPGVDGQVAVISRALATIAPESVSYVEAHGTGTILGDPVEVAALAQAYGREGEARCALGSVKTNIGHLDAAAGVVGLLKTVLALAHRELPPSLHFAAPNPKLDLAGSRFFVNARLSEWRSAPGVPRRAGVSSFGMGGTNAHVIMEEAPPLPERESALPRPCELLPLSATTPTALEAAITRLAGRLDEPNPPTLVDVAYTLGVGRKAFPHRAFLVCPSLAEARASLTAGGAAPLRRGQATLPKRPVVFLFPGQGSQQVNMLLDLYQGETRFRQEVDRCCETLRPHLGLDLRELLYPEAAAAEMAERRLRETAYAQPALFVMEYALAQLWIAWGVKPAAMLGHSLGEYVAACLAGVFSLDEALALVAARGKLMQTLPVGAMLSVILSKDAVRPFLAPELSLAAHNAPSRCVVSGPPPAIAGLKARLQAHGIEGVPLKTSHAFHSAMMDPMLAEFAARVGRVALRPPELPFVSNLTGTWITAEEATSPDYWSRHLRHSVRFSEGVATLLENPDYALLEVGPGRTLSGLARQHATPESRRLILSSAGAASSGSDAWRHLLSTVGELWLHGVTVDWNRFHGPRGARVPLPTYPFERQRYWVEPRPTIPRPAAKAPLVREPDPADWFYQPVWKQVPSVAAAGEGLAPKRWLVFAEDSALTQALIRDLQAGGHRVVTVLPGTGFERVDDARYRIAPANAADYLALCRALESGGGVPGEILHLWQVAAGIPGESLLEQLDASQAQGFYSLLFLAQALARHRNAQRRFRVQVITTQLQAVTGDESLDPRKATLLATIKLVPLEYDEITCRTVDVVAPGADQPATETLVRKLLAEIQSAAAEPIVALRGRFRWVPEFAARRFAAVEPAGPTPLKRHGVYLLTGGLGGIGLSLAEYLAEHHAARLILVGRSRFPERARWDDWLRDHAADDEVSGKIRTLRALEAKGAQVLVVVADIADPAAMQAALREGERAFGPVNGVIHAAGVIDHAGVIDKRTSPESTAAVLAPKVKGTLVLAQLFHDRPLDFLVLCSTTGNVLHALKLGEVGYTAANEFLDAFCHYQARHGRTLTLTIAWDDWAETGMSARAARDTGASGIGRGKRAVRLQDDPRFADWTRDALTNREGEDVFARLLAGVEGSGRVVVSTRNLPGLIEACAANAQRWQVPPPATACHARPELGNAFVAARTTRERELAAIWQRLLGTEPIGVSDDFFTLGGDSLLGIRLLAKIRETWGIELPMQRLFESPTVAGLAALLEARNEEKPMPPSADETEQETGRI